MLVAKLVKDKAVIELSNPETQSYFSRPLTAAEIETVVEFGPDEAIRQIVKRSEKTHSTVRRLNNKRIQYLKDHPRETTKN